MPSNNTPSPRRPLPSLGALLDTLGDATLRLASDSAGRELAVTRTVLLEPGRPVQGTVHGILLGLGLAPEGLEVDRVVGEAAAGGFAAVVVKRAGAEVEGAARVADAAGVALLVVDDAVEWLQLDRLVGTALSGTGAGTDAALSSLAVGDLFSLANVIATSTGGATTIEDLGRRVLAYSTVAGQEIDEERREGILGRQVPDLPPNDAQYAQLYRAVGVVEYPPEAGTLGRVAAAVRTGSEPLGSVWVVVPAGGLRPDADRTIASAAEIAALHLLRNRSSQDFARQRRTDLLRRLLDHDDAGAARQLNLNDPGQLAVVALQPTSSPDQGSVDLGRLLDVVSLELEARLGPTGCVDHAGRVYALVSAGDSAERALPALRAAVRAAGQAMRVGLACGISRPPRHAWHVSAAREEADRVVDLVLADPAVGPVASAAALVDSLRLLSLADQHPAVADISETAATILAVDAEHGTDHAALVLTWFESQGDVRAVADRLGIHANTVRYRLRRLEQLHGLSRDDPDQSLLVWLALRLHRHTAPLPSSPQQRLPAGLRMPTTQRRDPLPR